MRITFVKTLEQLAESDKQIFLVTGDLGFSVFEQFSEKFPNQFLNAGVAEQNMTGLAAGMALEGFTPFIYSIVPFVTMRNFEQIRDDICYHNANVKIVGVGAGFSYGIYGYTHNALEDIAVMRALPNMTVIAPADAIETELAVREAVNIRGPVYIRLAKTGEPLVHVTSPNFKVGKSIMLDQGKDIGIIATGTMVFVGQQVVKMLKENNISASLISMHTIKPLDTKAIIDLASEVSAIFTLEEHSIIGGLGSAVAEVLAENSSKTILKRIGTTDQITKVIGSQQFMREEYSLSPEKITEQVLSVIR